MTVLFRFKNAIRWWFIFHPYDLQKHVPWILTSTKITKTCLQKGHMAGTDEVFSIPISIDDWNSKGLISLSLLWYSRIHKDGHIKRQLMFRIQ